MAHHPSSNRRHVREGSPLYTVEMRVTAAFPCMRGCQQSRQYSNKDGCQSTVPGKGLFEAKL